jgi:hypothetical protein
MALSMIVVDADPEEHTWMYAFVNCSLTFVIVVVETTVVVVVVVVVVFTILIT